MGDDFSMPRERRLLLDRILKFSRLTTHVELRAQMWRLSETVRDRDCPESIVEDCQPLYGLVGNALAAKLAALLPELESRVARNYKSRDRIEAIAVTKSLLMQDSLRDFYFNMSESDLQSIWNAGDNELPIAEKELVRIALRKKIGIESANSPPQICPHCFLPRKTCICERGWW